MREHSVESVSEQVRFFNDNRNFQNLFGKPLANITAKQSNKAGSDGALSQVQNDFGKLAAEDQVNDRNAENNKESLLSRIKQKE